MIIPNGLIEKSHTSELDRPVYFGEDSIRYNGPIFRISTGAIFTGSQPGRGSMLLYYKDSDGTKINPAQLYNDNISNNNIEDKTSFNRTQYNFNIKNNLEYANSMNEDPHTRRVLLLGSETDIPVSITDKPLGINYVTGYYIKYIVKYYNNNSFYYTSGNNYLKYRGIKNYSPKVNTIYTVQPLKWYIRAKSIEDIIRINRFNTQQLENNTGMSGLSKFIIDYAEYYSDPYDNLLTLGRELITREGGDYKGIYYIDQDNKIFQKYSTTNPTTNELFLSEAIGDEGIERLGGFAAVQSLINNYYLNESINSSVLNNASRMAFNNFKTQTLTNNTQYTNGGSSGGGGGY
jgi:hypothetical protein